MIQAMQSGIAGMQAYQQALSVTSNNIANASTTAFKKQQAQFTDLLYTNTMSGSVSDLYASTNSMSIGSGSKLSSVQTDYSAGAATTTGRLMDAALTGDGLFVVGDITGGSIVYTRNGSFSVSSDGYVINQNGQYVLGYATGMPIGRDPQPIEIEIGKAVPGVASTRASLSGNLPLNPTYDEGKYTKTSQITVYNDAGEKVMLAVDFTWTEESGNENVEVTITMLDPEEPNNSIVVGTTSLDFSVSPFHPELVDISASGATGLVLDLSSLTMFDTTATVSAKADGSGAKVATSYYIGDGGSVYLYYSDGSTEELAKLAVATFTNNDGMVQQGDGTYTPGISAGQVSFGVAGENGAGSIRGGALEASNVDLATEFVDLMVYQKGFQGSTKIISISNDILSEVVGLIR